MNEDQLGLLLLQVLILLVSARALGELLRSRGYPALIGEIMIGIFLGPTLFGRAWPELQAFVFPDDPIQLAMFDTVAWFGVLFLLLETGLEVDVSAAWRQRGSALRIGIIGVLVPLIIGFALALALPDRYMPNPEHYIVFALFLATTMAISAMVIIARVLHDFDLVKTDLGLVTLCGYAVNDVLAWIMFSVVFGFAAHATVDFFYIAFVILFAVGITAFSLTAGLRLTDKAISFLGGFFPERTGILLSFVCSLGLAYGALTQGVGLTALLGFFLAGVMAGESKALTERTRVVMGQMIHAIFVPLYFAGIGLRFDFIHEFDWLIVGFVTIVSIGAKFLGAWLGAIGKSISKSDRLSIGIAFTPSGVTGIVVADIAVEYNILSTEVFVAIVVSAVISSLLVAPWLSWSINRRKAIDVVDFFIPSSVIPQLEASSRWEAIDTMCESVVEQAKVARVETIISAVRTREELIGTGVGHGVAIPHARLPNLNRAVITFGRSINGLDWDSPDGVPVHFVFLILTPEEDQGIQVLILAALARAMEKEDTRQRLMKIDGANKLWEMLRRVLLTSK